MRLWSPFLDVVDVVRRNLGATRLVSDLLQERSGVSEGVISEEEEEEDDAFSNSSEEVVSDFRLVLLRSIPCPGTNPLDASINRPAPCRDLRVFCFDRAYLAAGESVHIVRDHADASDLGKSAVARFPAERRGRIRAYSDLADELESVPDVAWGTSFFVNSALEENSASTSRDWSTTTTTTPTHLYAEEDPYLSMKTSSSIPSIALRVARASFFHGSDKGFFPNVARTLADRFFLARGRRFRARAIEMLGKRFDAEHDRFERRLVGLLDRLRASNGRSMEGGSGTSSSTINTSGTINSSTISTTRRGSSGKFISDEAEEGVLRDFEKYSRWLREVRKYVDGYRCVFEVSSSAKKRSSSSKKTYPVVVPLRRGGSSSSRVVERDHEEVPHFFETTGLEVFSWSLSAASSKPKEKFEENLLDGISSKRRELEVPREKNQNQYYYYFMNEEIVGEWNKLNKRKSFPKSARATTKKGSVLSQLLDPKGSGKPFEERVREKAARGQYRAEHEEANVRPILDVLGLNITNSVTSNNGSKNFAADLDEWIDAYERRFLLSWARYRKAREKLLEERRLFFQAKLNNNMSTSSSFSKCVEKTGSCASSSAHSAVAWAERVAAELAEEEDEAERRCSRKKKNSNSGKTLKKELRRKEAESGEVLEEEVLEDSTSSTMEESDDDSTHDEESDLVAWYSRMLLVHRFEPYEVERNNSPAGRKNLSRSTIPGGKRKSIPPIGKFTKRKEAERRNDSGKKTKTTCVNSTPSEEDGRRQSSLGRSVSDRKKVVFVDDEKDSKSEEAPNYALKSPEDSEEDYFEERRGTERRSKRYSDSSTNIATLRSLPLYEPSVGPRSHADARWAERCQTVVGEMLRRAARKAVAEGGWSRDPKRRSGHWRVSHRGLVLVVQVVENCQLMPKNSPRTSSSSSLSDQVEISPKHHPRKNLRRRGETEKTDSAAPLGREGCASTSRSTGSGARGLCANNRNKACLAVKTVWLRQ